SFAHVCDTGGARRTWLRGFVNVAKRYLVHVAAHNLAVVLRALFGAGKPRCLQAGGGPCAAALAVGAGLAAGGAVRAGPPRAGGGHAVGRVADGPRHRDALPTTPCRLNLRLVQRPASITPLGIPSRLLLRS